MTVRTLHHYDRIGLLTPSGRTPAGYRQKDPTAPPRLARSPRAPAAGPCGQCRPRPGARRELARGGEDEVLLLRRQHRLLLEQRDRTDRMVAAVEKEMEAQDMGTPMSPEEKLEVFGDWLPEEYADEAEQRWGDTEAWSQSQARTGSHTKADWLAIKAETDDLERRLAAALADGAPADGERAMDLAEEHRQHEKDPTAPHDTLRAPRVPTAGPTGDERFTAYYEGVAPGLAGYLSTACQANAVRQG